MSTRVEFLKVGPLSSKIFEVPISFLDDGLPLMIFFQYYNRFSVSFNFKRFCHDMCQNDS